MATQLWDQEIDKNVDWAGDTTTGGAAVSGKYVQKFIKDSLEKKFGYLHYDKAALKYYVFADEENYNLYANDNTGAYSNLLLGTFDAPAPATITVTVPDGSQMATVLLGSTNNKLVFDYYIENSSGTAVTEVVTMRIAFSRGGETQTMTKSLPIDYEAAKKEPGTHYEQNIDSYLTQEGTYTITVTLTGQTTSATTTFAYSYNVVNLVLDCTGFSNLTAISYDAESFYLPYTVTGGAGLTKTIELYIDGEPLYQESLGYGDVAVSYGEGMGTNSPISGTLEIFLKDFDGNNVKWPEDGKWRDAKGKEIGGTAVLQNSALAGKPIFGSGKHSLQIAFYIPGDKVGDKIYSLTKYFDIVVSAPVSQTERYTYVLYSADLAAGEVFDPTKPIEFECNQYSSTTFNVAVYDSGNRDVQVIYELIKDEEKLDTLTHTVSSGSEDTFKYTFTTYGDVQLNVYANSADSDKQLDIKLNVVAAEYQVNEYDTNLIVKYSATNKSNTATDRDVWTNSSTNYASRYPYPATFNRVLWNAQSGWDGECLTLKNGATVTFPFNIFELYNNGLTFEIEFETSDVKDDNAVIMDFSDTGNNRSYIQILATQATMCTNGESSIKTNFKDGERTKIAFVFNPLAQINDANKYEGALDNPNLLMIMVNGVMDRVTSWGNGSVGSDTVKWANAKGANANSFTIGNTSGAATVKIYTIRVYNSYLTPEQSFQNYMNDAGDNLLSVYEKNDVLDGSTVSYEKVKDMIPTMLMFMDLNSHNNTTNKKANQQVDVLFHDPEHPDVDFYARNAWYSPQGTSSMQYPVKNGRLYFGKTADSKTYNKISLCTDGTDASTHGINTTPEYETEWWPGSEFLSKNPINNFDPNFFDTILPYGTNKKVDDEDGVSHWGWHKVGANLTSKSKDEIAANWDGQVDVYGNTEYLFKLLSKSAGGKKWFPANIVKAGDLNTATEDYYISEYRPVRRTDMTDDEYWLLLRELRYAGAKFFKRKDYTAKKGYTVKAVDNGKGKNVWAVVSAGENGKDVTEFLETDGAMGWNDDVCVTYKEVKKSKPIAASDKLYILGSYWKQWDYSGWTDRWTIKADYAESSMCHNAGTGRLWGAALKGVSLNGEYVGRTGAQLTAAKIDGFFDVRTSCDGKPIVMFAKKPAGYDPVTGKMTYGAIEYMGLYNIMTDKGSTKLFGFEDLYDENGKKVFDASLTQCWECLSNGSLIAQGTSYAFDEPTNNEVNTTGDKIGDGRSCWTSYESRWPDSGQERHGDDKYAESWPDDVYGCESNNLESFWQWVAFTKPAVDYRVSGIDGYKMSPFVALTSAQAAEYNTKYTAAVAAGNEEDKKTYMLYVYWTDSGNDAYAAMGETYTNDSGDSVVAEYNPNAGIEYYKYDYSIDMEAVTKDVNKQTIGQYYNNSDIYLGSVPSFDAKYRCIDDEGNVDEDEALKYYVDVYMYRNGTRYFYTDHQGVEQVYTDSVDSDDFLTNKLGRSWKNYTFMDFFSETKYQHIDVYKVAAYYIYIIRFCAVDQVVKNTMMATEGPTADSNGNYIWWFINYDNDTTLGVRNDGHLVFNWDCTRDTYDKDGNGYSFAGAKSVLWNNLAADADFMAIVKSIDQAMYSQGLLTTKAVLNMYNDKQEGVWCERLYNAQEDIKYLTTIKNDFTNTKFLPFMHGTRHSHRVWWVNHRWELFDAQWSTGSYADKKVGWLLEIPSATTANPIEFLRITAASKYYFTTQSNNRTEYSDWFVELKADDTAVFKTTKSLAKGDPMTFIGPQKVKVFDMRAGSQYMTGVLQLVEPYQITQADGSVIDTNWVNESGTMMTKLLLGDGKNKCGTTILSGVNNITSLEECDFRNAYLVESSPSIDRLVNLHRWRVGGSSLNIFEPAQGVTLYEAALTEKTIKIALQDVTFMAGDDDFNDETVDYSASASAYKYCKTYDEATGTLVQHNDYVFDYTPAASLSDVSFLNVTGIDTMQFVIDWHAALLADNITPSTCKLKLTKVQWTGIDVETLINIYNDFDLANSQFTGSIYVIGSGDGGKLTQDEYNELLEVFGENAFKSSNALVLNAAENMFFAPTDNSYVAKTATAGQFAGLADGTNYYDVVRGEQFIVNATIFPVSDDVKYEYVMYYRSGSSWVNPNATGDSSNRVYNYSAKGIVLTNNDGKAILTSDEDTTWGDTPIIRIQVMGVAADGTATGANYSQINSQYIYVNMVNQIIPNYDATSIVEIVNGAEQPVSDIIDEETHTFSVKFGAMHDTFNVKVNSMTVSLSSTNNTLYTTGSDSVTVIDKSSIVVDNVNKKFTFSLSNTIQAADTDVPVYVKINFNTSRTQYATVVYTLNLKVKSIYAEAIEIYDSSNNLVELFDAKNNNKVTLFLNHCVKTDYTVKILPENYNVALTNASITIGGSNASDSMTLSNVSTSGFSITVSNNYSATSGKYISFDETQDLVVKLVPKYNADTKTVESTVKTQAAIVYPERVYLERNTFNVNGNYEMKDGKIAMTTSPSIYLTNCQGTSKGDVTTDEFRQLKGSGSNGAIHYDIKVAASDSSLGEVTENYNVNITEFTIETTNGEEVNVDKTMINYSADYTNGVGAVLSGASGFDLSIVAVKDKTNTVTCTIKGSIEFDYDDADPAVGDTSMPFELSFLVVRSVATATTFDEIAANTWYAVDKGSRFYSVELNEDGTAVTRSNAITLSGNTGDDWVGIAIKLGTGRYCISLKAFGPGAFASADSSIARVTGISSAYSDKASNNGYTITEWFVDKYLSGNGAAGVTATDKEVGFYKAWHMLDSKQDIADGIRGYVPSLNEMKTVITGGNWKEIKKLMIYLNSQANGAAAPCNLIDANAANDTIYFWTSTVNAGASSGSMSLKLVKGTFDGGEITTTDTGLFVDNASAYVVELRPFIKLD